MAKSIPKYVLDLLLHVKDTNGKESVILPITRYDNVMNAPKVVSKNSSLTDMTGHPFVLLKTGEEAISIETLRKLCGGIV